MRCQACGNENRSEQRYCTGCGAALRARCTSCGASAEAGDRFCGGCGEPLATAPPPPVAPQRQPLDYTPRHLVEHILKYKSALEGERKQVTILFADVKGSVALSEQVDPEEWHRILDRFFEILARGVHRFEGTVNQFTGDGIMALFGAPIAHEDHAHRACYAALYLQQSLRDYADELRRTRGLNFLVRMGLNSGEVVVGKIGDDLRTDYTAQGYAVGLASRVQELAPADRIFLGHATARLVTGFFQLEDLGAFEFKGVRQRVPLFELKGIGEIRSRLELSRSRGFTRFLGREAEMQVLEGALERALGGEVQLVCFMGEAGVGKSRLCHEFLERCRGRGVPCTNTQGVAHGRKVPLFPVLALYRQALGVSERDSPQEAREKIAGRVLLLDASLADDLPLVFDFLGVADPERPAPRLSPEERQRRLVEFDAKYSAARSRREPMVTLYEDLQWFDQASLGWVLALLETATETRTLIVANFRPDFEPQQRAPAFRAPCRLEPLAAQTAAELLDSLLGEDPGLGELKGKILSVAEGNPFFIEEVLRSLIESGHLLGSSGSYRLDGTLPEIEIPTPVQAVLAARIDQLAEGEKRLLQTIAVIGRTVSRALLDEVSEQGAEAVDAALSRLVRREFLFEKSLYPAAEYEFEHSLTREVAYRSQLGERRARTHATVAKAIQRVDTERLDENAALIAHHCEEARDEAEAARWHQRAAEWIHTQDVTESQRHRQRAQELLRRLDPGRK